MKNIQKWFNGLSSQQQKLMLVGFCFVFALLLSLSIRYSQLSMKTGSILQPRTKIDSIKTK